MLRPLLSSLLLVPALAAAGPWGEVRLPSAELPQVYGGYAAGCIAGAQTLPLSSPGYQAMRPSRNRYYGHPELLRFIEQLGYTAAARRFAPVLIGDLGQPRGGPMLSGHRSHQIGLDVDVWFLDAPGGRAPSGAALESLSAQTMIDPYAGRVLARFGARQRALLRAAADDPAVERIFVNPVIKQSLCRSEADRGWLHKIRPWWGHDAHFHVRLYCPPDSPQCSAQKPIEPGDGCDAGLDAWVEEIRQAARRPPLPTPPAPEPVLPEACTAVLQAPSASARR